MGKQRAAWRAVFLGYECPRCGAKPNEDCRSEGGKRQTMVHAARTRTADRCPRCGVHVGIDGEPGTYCQRCALLRALEIERVTKHRRVT
jgi:DNA-directed RNA polymerase subunit RPC12/RpoP